jgi:protocatechuate 3,4-dioxygenase beta subunit
MTTPTSPLPAIPTDALDELDDDDRPVGRILTRREVLALIGAGGTAAFLAACTPTGSASPGGSGAASAAASASASAAATAVASAAIASALPACVVAPELTEGPYYVDVDLERSDIRSDTGDGVAVDGAPLVLDWVVSQTDRSACMPMEGVIVDVWHCDALGTYSGVQGNTANFLRGFQRTDSQGKASFTTIYPGWYQGRTVHIHVMVHVGGNVVHTGQLYFSDALTDAVFRRSPYSRRGARDVRNPQDAIYRNGGRRSTLTVRRSGSGYVGAIAMGVHLA